MRRPSWISLIAIIVVCVSLLFVLYLQDSPPSSQGTKLSIDSNVRYRIDQYYLTKMPYFSNNVNETTKIFLENATLQYSNFSFTSDSGRPDKFEVVRAAVVNATVRNDYTPSEIIQFSEAGTSRADFWLDVYLYDEEGNVVDTLQQGNPFFGSVQLVLNSGEIASVNLVFAVPKSNINYFEIYVSYPPNIPVS